MPLLVDGSSMNELFDTTAPSRLDNLPWCRFHSLLVAALGVTWILDGLEITLMGAIAAVLQQRDVLGFSSAQIGFISSCYLIGAVLGALAFGYLTDRFGRRKFFFLTLSIYLAGVGLTACSWDLASFAVFRLITGAGIGGEYGAINSAIDELTPARLRGRVALIVNGGFWLGAAAAAVLSSVILDPKWFLPDIGWRLGFALGPLLGTIILYLRRFVPESPRWQLTHGRRAEGEATVNELEAMAFRDVPPTLRPEYSITIDASFRAGLRLAAKTIFAEYRDRALLAVGLMAAQAFAYNAIFFTYGLVLHRYYSVVSQDVGIYLLPFALANFAGPLLLGRFFDTIGRRLMIFTSFVASGALLMLIGVLFAQDRLSLHAQVGMWVLTFFVASAAASSAYLTVSELFPLELRALAIAIFYSAGTAIGGIAGPWVFGALIDTGSRGSLGLGYAFAATLMSGAGVLELWLGPDAERRGLEAIAAPLSSRR